MKTISFKVTEDEDRALRRQALRANVSVSELLRRKIRARDEAPEAVEIGRCAETGATVFAGAVNGQRLTVESVREMLSDFP